MRICFVSLLRRVGLVLLLSLRCLSSWCALVWTLSLTVAARCCLVLPIVVLVWLWLVICLISVGRFLVFLTSIVSMVRWVRLVVRLVIVVLKCVYVMVC